MLRTLMLLSVCLLAPISHAQQKPLFVAFALYGPHPALQSQVDGFKDRMTKSGYVEGKNIRYVQQDVTFNPALVSQLLTVLEAMGPDMIQNLGSDFDDFLAEEGMLEEVTAVAVKRAIAWQIEQEMSAQKITKTAMAKKMRTSRASLNRLLDANDTSLTLTTLAGAAAALGRRIKLELAPA